MSNLFRERGNEGSRIFLAILTCLLLFVPGCSSSDNTDVTVATGAEPAATGFGSLTFNFIRAQGVITVPLETTQLQFRFFNGAAGAGTVVLSSTVAYANTVTINNVPTTAQSVVITPIAGDGAPLLEATVPVVVTPGNTVVVDVTGASIVPVNLTGFTISPDAANVQIGGTQQYVPIANFSNGTVISPSSGVVYSSSPEATISPAGLATGVSSGNATISADYRGANDTATLVVLGGTVVSIDVFPVVSSAQVGQQVQFVAIANLSNNSTVQPTVGLTWTSTVEANITQTGLANGVSIGTATITATFDGVMGTATLNVIAPAGNQNPVIDLDPLAAGNVDYIRNRPAVNVAPAATFSDDQGNLNGGTLSLRVGSGDLTGIQITLPGAPAIGVISNNGTDHVTVALDANATPANIQTVLQGATFQTTGTTSIIGLRNIVLQVTDGAGGGTTASRGLNVRNYLVGPAGDFATITAALAEVALNGPTASTIEVSGGSYIGEGAILISNLANLDGTTLQGPNSTIGAGTNNPLPRATEAIVSAFDIGAPNVTLNGFRIQGGSTSAGADDQGVFVQETASGASVLNSVFQYTGVSANSRGVLTRFAATPNNVVVNNNYFTGWRGAGFFQGVSAANRSSGHMVLNNVVDGNDVGFSNDFVENVTYSGNAFANAALNEHIAFFGSGANLLVNNNDFTGGSVAIFGASAQNINAENNWWGQATGPLVTQIQLLGTGTIDSDPFLTVDPFVGIPTGIVPRLLLREYALD